MELTSLILSIFVGTICTEATTELVVHSEILSFLREYLKKLSKFTGKMVQCGYCFSVWAAFFWANFIRSHNFANNNFIDLLIWTLIFHRLSNFLNDFADKYLKNDAINDLLDEESFDKADQAFGINHGSYSSTEVDLSGKE